MTIPKKAFYFMRHGETNWNNQQLYMGSSDIPLNKTGIEQAKIAAQLLKSHRIEHIISSPLLRAYKTAQIISEVINKPITLLEELKERYLGKKEGKLINKTIHISKWLAEDALLGEEPAQNFQKRVINAIIHTLNQRPEPSLIIAHGGVYCALSSKLNWPLIELKNCQILYHKPQKELLNLWDISDIGFNKD